MFCSLDGCQCGGAPEDRTWPTTYIMHIILKKSIYERSTCPSMLIVALSAIIRKISMVCNNTAMGKENVIYIGCEVFSAIEEMKLYCLEYGDIPWC